MTDRTFSNVHTSPFAHRLSRIVSAIGQGVIFMTGNMTCMPLSCGLTGGLLLHEAVVATCFDLTETIETDVDDKTYIVFSLIQQVSK